MLVFSRFSGDENYKDIQWIQHDMYWYIIGDIVTACKEPFLKAAEFCLEEDLIYKVNESRGFDHRTLQDSHDFLAAIYRYIYGQSLLPIFKTRDFTPFEIDNLKYAIEKTDRNKHPIMTHWLDFYNNSISELCLKSNFVKSVIFASILYPNTKIGGNAEMKTSDIVLEHFGFERIDYTKIKKIS